MFMYVYVVGIRVRVLCNLWSNVFETLFFFGIFIFLVDIIKGPEHI